MAAGPTDTGPQRSASRCRCCSPGPQTTARGKSRCAAAPRSSQLSLTYSSCPHDPFVSACPFVASRPPSLHCSLPARRLSSAVKQARSERSSPKTVRPRVRRTASRSVVCRLAWPSCCWMSGTDSRSGTIPLRELYPAFAYISITANEAKGQ